MKNQLLEDMSIEIKPKYIPANLRKTLLNVKPSLQADIYDSLTTEEEYFSD